MEGVRLAVDEDEKRAISSDNRISERVKSSEIITINDALRNRNNPVVLRTVHTLWPPTG